MCVCACESVYVGGGSDYISNTHLLLKNKSKSHLILLENYSSGIT